MSIFYRDQLDKFREVLFYTISVKNKGFKLTEHELFGVFSNLALNTRGQDPPDIIPVLSTSVFQLYLKTSWDASHEVTDMSSLPKFKEFSKLIFDIIKSHDWNPIPVVDTLRNRVLYHGTMRSIKGTINVLYYLTDTRYLDIQFIYITQN